MKSLALTDRHQQLRADLVEALKKHSADMPAIEILAIVAQMLGQIIALQDQRKYTPAAVMKVVQANVEDGNRAVVDGLLHTQPKGRA